MKKVIIHYHIFKNAGSSIEKILSDAFGSTWCQVEQINPNAKLSCTDLQRFVDVNPEVRALSSHQAIPPVTFRGFEAHPIIFLRHPLDRAYSAYQFEWGVQRGLKKPRESFAEYIDFNFAHPKKNVIENFQTYHLANSNPKSNSPPIGMEEEDVLAQARSLMLGLPCFGIVEEFSASLALFAKKFAPSFPEVKWLEYRENATSITKATIAEKIRKIREDTPPQAYDQFVLRNQLDYRLYEYAIALFFRSLESAGIITEACATAGSHIQSK